MDVEYFVNSIENAISVKSTSLFNYFQVENEKLVSNFVTKEAVEDVRLLINGLEKHNVKIITQFGTGLQKYYYLTKTGSFMMVGLLRTLQNTAVASGEGLLTANGVAQMSLSGIMGISFLLSLTISAIIPYVSNGSWKDMLKITRTVVTIPRAIAQKTFNIVFGCFESVIGFAKTRELVYTPIGSINITETLGFLDGPIDYNYTNVLEALHRYNLSNRINYASKETAAKAAQLVSDKFADLAKSIKP